MFGDWAYTLLMKEAEKAKEKSHKNQEKPIELLELMFLMAEKRISEPSLDELFAKNLEQLHRLATNVDKVLGNTH
jgi:hypothetical protein